MIRTRFAPSPTGDLHLGGLRTALYAYLHARHHGEEGKFILRFEDTDQERYVRGSEEKIMTWLTQLGLSWDEGPYVQSQRLDKYREHATQLVRAKRAYVCDCTPERLAALRLEQSNAKRSPGYDGRCRNRDLVLEQGSVIRFNVKDHAPDVVVVEDVLHGIIKTPKEAIDDFVILKSDGFPTYHLAHVVDDHLMEISDVIRGDEWLPSFPKHKLLFDAFGWAPPRYAHLPVILGPSGKKLSKREGATLDTFMPWCLPAALLNFVALLGWNPSADQEVYTLDELVARFDLSKVNTSPSKANFEKLEWMNGEHIKREWEQKPEAMMTRVLRLKHIGKVKSGWKDKDGKIVDDSFVKSVFALEMPRLHRLDAFPDWYFKPYAQQASLAWKKSTLETAKQHLEALIVLLDEPKQWQEGPEGIERSVKTWISERGLTNGEVLWPMRVALSGLEASPGPFDLAWLLGRNETVRRLQRAIEQGI